MANRAYKARSKHTHTTKTDLDWYQQARSTMRDAFQRAFPPGTWPMRAKRMDRVLRAMHEIDSALYDGVIEVAASAGITIIQEDEQHGFPPRRG